MVPILFTLVGLLIANRGTAAEKYTVMIAKSDVENFGQFYRIVLTKDYVHLGYTRIRLHTLQFKEYMSPLIWIEVNARARYLWLQDVFPAHQLIPPLLHFASFSNMGVMNAFVIPSDYTNYIQVFKDGVNCTINFSPDELNADCFNVRESTCNYTQITELVICVQRVMTHENIHYTNSICILRSWLSSYFSQYDNPSTTAAILHRNEPQENSTIHDSTAHFPSTYFVEPLFTFGSLGYNEVFCWNNNKTSCSNSDLVGDLGKWHKFVTLLALVLSAFSPLLLFMCSRTISHVPDPNSDSNGLATTGKCSCKRDRLSFDTSPLPFGVSYVLLYWDKPMHVGRKTGMRSILRWCFGQVTIRPFLCLRLLLVSFIIQMLPYSYDNILILFSGDSVDDLTKARIKSYVLRPFFTFLSFSCVYLVIFLDKIDDTWFAHESLFFVNLKNKYNLLQQPNSAGKDIRENITTFISITSHRMSLLWRWSFWKCVLIDPIKECKRFAIPLIILHSLLMIILTCINAIPIVGYLQLALLRNKNSPMSTVQMESDLESPEWGRKRSHDPCERLEKTLFVGRQVFRIILVVASYRVITLVTFYIVGFIYVVLFTIVATKLSVTVISMLLTFAIIIIRPCNTLFGLYCKLFYSTIKTAKHVHELIPQLAVQLELYPNSMNLLKSVPDNTNIYTLLKEALKVTTMSHGSGDAEINKKKEGLETLIEYSKAGKPSIHWKLFWEMREKHLPTGWTIVVHTMFLYFIPIVSLLLLCGFYFDLKTIFVQDYGYEESNDFYSVLQVTDTSALLLITALLAIIWALTSSPEQEQCLQESLKAQYTYDVLHFALNGEVPKEWLKDCTNDGQNINTVNMDINKTYEIGRGNLKLVQDFYRSKLSIVPRSIILPSPNFQKKPENLRTSHNNPTPKFQVTALQFETSV